jgi:hypothetical protein
MRSLLQDPSAIAAAVTHSQQESRAFAINCRQKVVQRTAITKESDHFPIRAMLAKVQCPQVNGGRKYLDPTTE